VTDFVAFRVYVRPGESNRAALNRTLNEGSVPIPFPLTLTTKADQPYRFPSAAAMPDTNMRRDKDNWFVKYEAAT
jgi:hypothetical protein